MELTLADDRVLEYQEFGDPDGVPVVLFPGTPATAGGGALVSGAAADAGVRLIAVSRPGYGASSPSPPGLASTARDAVELMDALAVDRVGVHGTSGGGPFALALASVAPNRVSGVVVSAGVGASVTPSDPAADRAEADELYGDAAELSLVEFTARIFPSGLPPQSFLDRNPHLFELFITDMHRALHSLDGFVRDNESWCDPWDVDLASISAPVQLVYGVEDHMVPATHGDWIHARLPQSELIVRPGGHGDITFALAAEAYAYLVGG